MNHSTTSNRVGESFLRQANGAPPITPFARSLLDRICEVNSLTRSGKRKKASTNLAREMAGMLPNGDIHPLLQFENSSKLGVSWESGGWGVGWDLGSEGSSFDALLIGGVLDLAKTGSLGRLLKCDCGHYFLARVESQHFHSAKCREKAFKSTPEWKEYRNQKAREYYGATHSGKVK